MLALIAQEVHAPLTTYGQFRGILAVTTAVVVFVGGPLLILGTNIGYRKAAAVTIAALFGYLTIHGFLWMFYPRGPLVTHKVFGLPLSVSSRFPAILLMLGSATIMLILCLALNRLDAAQRDE